MNKIEELQNEIKKGVIGQDQVIEKILAAFLARGHVLLEDIPGVGKTNLALALSKALQLSYKRMQFTTDVMPSDIIGYTMYNRQTQAMEYVPGPVLSHLFLADEINRTSTKTQSALLEVMEENQVTVDGISHPTPEPFMVIATQNPIHITGTQPLPESQIDRFMICLSLGYLDKNNEILLLKRKQQDMLSLIHPVMRVEELLAMQDEADKVYIHDEVYQYIVDLVVATRNHPDIQLGISPRGSLALMKLGKAIAYMHDRQYVTPDDIEYMVYDVFCHRIILTMQARSEHKTEKQVVEEIVHEIKKPALKPR